MPRHPLCALKNLTKIGQSYPAHSRGSPFLSTSRLYLYLPYAIVKEQCFLPMQKTTKLLILSCRSNLRATRRSKSKIIYSLACRCEVQGRLLPVFTSLAQLRHGHLRSPLRSERRRVGVPGVEPGTSSLSGTRSNQLSYTPFARPKGLAQGKPYG